MDLEQLVENAGDAIVAAGTDGNIILWNAAAERIFGEERAIREKVRELESKH